MFSIGGLHSNATDLSLKLAAATPKFRVAAANTNFPFTEYSWLMCLQLAIIYFATNGGQRLFSPLCLSVFVSKCLKNLWTYLDEILRTGWLSHKDEFITKIFFLFLDMLKTCKRARTQNKSGHNMTKGTTGERGNTNSMAEGESRRRRTSRGCR